MVDEDEEFNPRVQEDLRERGFNIVDLGNGTFDLYVDLGKGMGFFIELKIANKHYKAHAKKKGLDLSNQTQAIWEQMESYPIVLACDKDDRNICYLVLPERLKELSEHRMEERGEDNILIGVNHLKKMEYKECINELVSFLKPFGE